MKTDGDYRLDNCRENSEGDTVLVHSAEIEYHSFLQAGFHVVNPDSRVPIQVGGFLRVRIFFQSGYRSA